VLQIVDLSKVDNLFKPIYSHIYIILNIRIDLAAEYTPVFNGIPVWNHIGN